VDAVFGTGVAIRHAEVEQMKVAVSAWEGRVSPVFDTARHIRCFDVDGGVGRLAGEAELPSDEPQSKLKKLKELGVSVLICGAISRPLAMTFSASGIQLVPFLAGEVEEVVQAFAEGRLEGACFHMPGCCGRVRRRRGWQCRGRWESRS
jgi:predicted Fe-Mo cluster-binding NifX family protein